MQDEPSLRGRVYVPPVYHELSSKRVLTTEWIEGVRLWDRGRHHRSPGPAGYGKGSPGVRGQQLDEPDMVALRRQLREDPHNQWLKPERTEWKGPRGKGGLGVTTKDVMTIMIDLFSAQIFKHGAVHSDPHPGVSLRMRGSHDLVARTKDVDSLTLWLLEHLHPSSAERPSRSLC